MSERPPVESIFPELIDSSMLTSFSSCPQQFFRQYIQGLRHEARSIHLHAGGCIARALDVFYTQFFQSNLPFDRALLRAQAAFTIEWAGVEAPKGSAKTEAICWDAIEHYLRIYPPASDNFQPFLNPHSGKPTYEFTFSVPITLETTGLDFPSHPVTGAPLLFGGRFDAFGLFGSRMAIRDEKTTSRFDSNWAEQWDLRGQFLGYVWACQQLGYDVDTVLVRGIRLTAAARATMDAQKTYSPHLVERWLKQTFRTVHRMVNCWNEGYWDYNFGHTCSSTFGGLCPYALLCKARNPDDWLGSYVVTRWNPVARENNALIPIANLDPSSPLELETTHEY